MRVYRRALHIAGGIFLVALIPLVIRFQLVGVAASLLPALICFVVAGAIGIVKSTPKPIHKKYISPCVIQTSSTGVHAFWNDQSNGEILWSEIEGVFIEIKSQGCLDVPHWHLAGKDKGVTFPSDSRGVETLLDQLRTHLPGFDSKDSAIQVMKAMEALEGLFYVWKKAA